MSLLELAFRWCVSQEHVDSILVGVSRLEQLKQNIDMVEKGVISQEILDECDEVWLRLRGKHAKYNRGKFDM
jgi:aryl-alcohol dehydrogenase (NADP+)